MSSKPVKPEIMSPAGYWPQLRAAIEAGANAVYFGLKHFTARAKTGFSLEELPEAMRTLHRRGVRGYVTFNTLVFDHEIDAAVKSLEAIAAAGADAIIVQDLGIASLARQILPDLELHGSTQMSITSAEGVKLAQRFGVTRVVLARELSLKEIADIRRETDCELEMFVHGALCVSYSGQCFSSEAWGGRSANRGQCAQACRLPYELLVDGRREPLGDARYLLSPGDLYTLRQVPEIVKLGISSLKIEGRYKDADYVALTTASYRKAVDEAWEGLPLTVSREEELRLEQVYSRGFGPYFVQGTNHQEVVKGRSPRHRGVYVGRVVRVGADHVLVEGSDAVKASPLKPGDGLVFDAADWRSPQENEEGGRVFEVGVRQGLWELRFGNRAVDFGRVRVGDWVWRSHDPEVDKYAKRFLEPAAPVTKQGVSVSVTARVGEPLRMVWRVGGIEVSVGAEEALVRAQGRALTLEGLREQLGRLGNTGYALRDLEAVIAGEPFVAASVLNGLRREAVERLESAQERGPVWRPAADLEVCPTGGNPSNGVWLHLLVRTPEQLDGAIAARPASITLDYLELYGLRPSVEKVRAAGIEARVASPRVLKPAEQRIVHFLLKLGCPILVRSAGLLQALREGEHPELIGDFSLNAANGVTAAALLDLGLTRITPTHDLNAEQIADLARHTGGAVMEVVAYHHLPVFHTEHCVFCRFLSKGTSFEDCGHPCEKHRVALKDDAGRQHPVMADVGCRNTVFNAEAQQAAQHLAIWRDAGIGHFRLEFVHQSAAQVEAIAGAFRRALSGEINGAQLERLLARHTPQGLTQGSLYVPANYKELPVLQ